MGSWDSLEVNAYFQFFGHLHDQKSPGSYRPQSPPLLLRRLGISLHLPKGGGQPHVLEDHPDLRGRAAPIVCREPIVIPALGELPHGLHGQQFAPHAAVGRTPGIDQLFRPEEQDRASGEDHVFVPAGKGDQEVDHGVRG